MNAPKNNQELVDQTTIYRFLDELSNLEQRVRFELTVLGICNPLRWASPPPLQKTWKSYGESNPASQDENLMS